MYNRTINTSMTESEKLGCPSHSVSESPSGSDDDSSNDESGPELPTRATANRERGKRVKLKRVKLTDRLKRPFSMLRLRSATEGNDETDCQSLGAKVSAAISRYVTLVVIVWGDGRL